MARVYLDTNIYIDLIERRRNIDLQTLGKHSLYISPLSTHILCYSYKHKIPHKELSRIQEVFGVVDLTNEILNSSLLGPTNDLEDNIQLHSAAEEECDYFLTKDSKLLEMKFFGKTRIVDSL